MHFPAAYKYFFWQFTSEKDNAIVNNDYPKNWIWNVYVRMQARYSLNYSTDLNMVLAVPKTQRRIEKLLEMIGPQKCF